MIDGLFLPNIPWGDIGHKSMKSPCRGFKFIKFGCVIVYLNVRDHSGYGLSLLSFTRAEFIPRMIPVRIKLDGWLLILLVRRLEYFGWTMSIPWLLMPWRHVSPGHHQPWYWLCRINGSLFYMRKKFKNLRHLSAEKRRENTMAWHWIADPVHWRVYIDGLVQDYSISIALAVEILQSCTKPSISVASSVSPLESQHKWLHNYNMSKVNLNDLLC